MNLKLPQIPTPAKLGLSVGGIALLILGVVLLYFMVFRNGEEHAKVQIKQDEIELINRSREADALTTNMIVVGTDVINNRAIEVKEVIREVPNQGISDVSRARLERVREQQRASKAQ
jgi:flagellar basal body-associated protein FliL